jgi:N utilization substance protein B
VARRKGRILAFQALYSHDVGNVPLDNILNFSWVESSTLERLSSDDTLTFARLIISGTLEHLDEIDTLIKKHLVSWDFDRLNRVDLAILRMSIYSLLYQKDIPSPIVIDEAIEISKEYGSDESYTFINALLDNIRKTI